MKETGILKKKTNYRFCLYGKLIFAIRGQYIHYLWLGVSGWKAGGFWETVECRDVLFLNLGAIYTDVFHLSQLIETMLCARFCMDIKFGLNIK